MNIYRVAISVIAMLLICTAQVGAKPGNGGGKPKPEPEPVETSCADAESESAFPAFAYTVQKRGRKNISGYDIYLSNAFGDCSIKIHTSDYSGSYFEISYSQNENEGVIVWRQAFNEYGGRKDADRLYDLIKIIRFETDAKAVTSSLPLASSTVAVSTANRHGLLDIDLSADGKIIVVAEGIPDGDYDTYTISEIDISICSEECELSPPLLPFIDQYIFGVSYSPLMDRIYFNGTYNDDPSDPSLADQHFVAFIEKQVTSWSAPRLVTLSSNEVRGDANSFRKPDVAFMESENGLTEVLAFNYEYYNGQWQDTLMILDVGNCSATGSGDCLSLGEASVFRSIADGGSDASFDNKFNATSLFATQDASVIVKHDLLANEEGAFVTDGFQADSGN